jgi:hypothetical protein
LASRSKEDSSRSSSGTFFHPNQDVWDIIKERREKPRRIYSLFRCSET